VLSDALNTKALIRAQQDRREEALGLMRHALDLALELDLPDVVARAYFNLAFLMGGRDRWADAAAADEAGLEYVRRRGNRQWEESFRGHLRGYHFILGDWEELEERLDAHDGRAWEELPWTLRLDSVNVMVPIAVARGRLDEAREIMARVPTEERAEVQERASIAIGRNSLALAEGRPEEAIEGAIEIAELRGSVGADHPMFKHGIVLLLSAAAELGDFTRLEPLFEGVRGLPPALRSPVVTAQLARFDGHLAARSGDRDTADLRLRDAAELLRAVGARFWLAIVLLERAELLFPESPVDAEPLLAEASETFARLEAAPWLERASRLQSEHTFA
jgi:hypothetical protein